MASIVFGLATSRSPLLSGGVDIWTLMGERDKRSLALRDGNGVLHTYAELLAKAAASMAQVATPATWELKHQASQLALATVVQRLADSKPDVVVVMGDDEEEYIHDDLRPAITLYRGQSWLSIPAKVDPSDPLSRATSWQWGREQRTVPIAAALTTHVLQYLVEDEFDVADSVSLKAMAHGFGFVYERLLTERAVPMVPLIINVHTPPAQPTPRRCYRLGRAVRSALEAWPEPQRVAVIATGGLSVGVLEETLDRTALEAIQERDLEAISKLPRGWMQGSAGEVLCWITAAGALEHLHMDLVDYIPAYRSPAGTGAGLAFATWS